LDHSPGRSAKPTRGFAPWLAPVNHPSEPAEARTAEARLLAAARQGDGAALEQLLERLGGTVQRFGQGFCRDRDEAQDLMQDVLRTLLRTLPSFRGESALSTWAHTVARRACARRKRRMARMSSLEDQPALLERPDPGRGPSEHAERRELGAAIDQAIAALPAHHREVVLLRDVEGLPAAEVAKVLGIGERAVKSRLHRARLTLRELLAPHADAGVESGGVAGAERKRCPDTVRLLSRHLEGELDSGVCGRLAQHVSGCASCGAACDALRQVLGACREWGERPLPDAEQRRVRDAIRIALAAERRAAH
jgi:RNA polymerase sigma-70 factor (ECF subfamily)